jgi:hypothetical protein
MTGKDVRGKHRLCLEELPQNRRKQQTEKKHNDSRKQKNISWSFTGVGGSTTSHAILNTGRILWFFRVGLPLPKQDEGRKGRPKKEKSGRCSKRDRPGAFPSFIV